MSKKAIHWVALQDSKAHQILRTRIAAAGLSVDALREMLWAINAHSELVAFPRICANLRKILSVLSLAWSTAENPSRRAVLEALHLADWPALLHWIVSHRQELIEAIGPLFERRPSKAGKSLSVMSRGATRHPLYACLWNRHQDRERRRRYWLLQGHLLIAHVAVLREQHKDDLEASILAYEQYGGKKEWKGLPNSPYQATLAIRYFSSMDWGQEELLDQYRVELPPQEFIDHLVGVSPPNDWQMLRRHNRLTNFLWKVSTGQWRRRTGIGRGEGTGGKWVRGYMELGDNLLLQKSFLGDPEDPDGDWGEQEVATCCGGTCATRQELLAIDDYPGEDGGDEDLYQTGYGEDDKEGGTRSTGDRMAASKAQVKHIEMANQLLPWAYPTLSDGEVRSFLAGLKTLRSKIIRRKKGNKQPEEFVIGTTECEHIELLALVSTMLWTGSPLERVLELKIFFQGTPNDDADLALFIDALPDSTPRWYPSCWRLRALQPQYRQPVSQVTGQERQREDYLFLGNLEPDISFWVMLLKGLRDSAKAVSPERPQALRCFRRTAQWYGSRLNELLRELDPTGRLTAYKLSGWLFARVVNITGGDVAAAALLTGQPHRLAHVRHFYATPSVAALQSLYREALGSLSESHGPSSPGTPSQGSVGSRLCPTFAAVQTAVQRLQEEIEAAAEYSKTPDWVRYHNLYSLYSLWAFAYTTGVRGIRTPYLSTTAVDPITGFARLTDKDSGIGYKTRLLWIPPWLRKQMRYYRRHLETVRLTVQGSPELLEEPCLLLDSREQAHASEQALMVRPKTLQSVMREFLPFPANVHRRFIRTELLSRQCPPEIVDAWMGHWHRGEEPWGEHSCFSYADYQQKLQKHLVPLLAELGFRPLRSCRA